MQPIKVLIVEDYKPFRQLVCSMLCKRADFQVTEASEGLEAVRMAEQLQPDLILLDIGLPNLNGFEVARCVCKLAPGAKMLFLSQEGSSDIVAEALNIGAKGYVQKLHTNVLMSAVDVVLNDETFVSNGLCEVHMTHYHFRFSKRVLDGEAFHTRAEAEAAAARLVCPGETYTIEERDDSCPRCWKSFTLRAPSPNPRQNYEWQQAVLDALSEPDAQQRIRKVSWAQRMISARLPDLTPTEVNERDAIREALRALRSLVPETKPDEETQQKRDIA